MTEIDDNLILNSISARALKAYFTSKIGEMVDDLVVKKYFPKKKPQYKRPETRIPVDLIKPDFVTQFNLKNYKDGVLVSLINSLVENNFFTSDGKLKDAAKEKLVLTNIEKCILEKLARESPLYIDISDVKILSSRLKTCADCFTYKDKHYQIKQDKIEELINQLVENGAICLDEKCSIKDSVYTVDSELLNLFKMRLFRCPQVKDNFISKTRLYDYFNRVTKHESGNIYVILKSAKIAKAFNVETIKVGDFLYTKYSILANAISSHVDRYSKQFQEDFYKCIAEFVKDNEKVNVSKIIECLTVPNVSINVGE